MTSNALFAIIGIIAVACVSAAILINVTLGAVVRLKALQQRSVPNDLAERLDRIEHAVEAMAIEVERNGEVQRALAGQSLGGRMLPLAGDPGRVITPH